MFGFIKKVCFFATMTFFSCNALKSVSVNNQDCKIRTKIRDINNNEPLFYPYSINVSKCSCSCINVNDPLQNHMFLMLLKT